MPQRPHKNGMLGDAPRRALALVIAAILLFSASGMHTALAQSILHEVKGAISHTKVIRGKSRTFEVAVPFSSAVVGAPDIADVLPVSDRVLYVQGKKAGTTNISIFDSNKHIVAILDVDVIVDTSAVAKRIRTNIGSKSITVSSSQEQLILGGMARNSVEAEQAAAIAKSAAPELQLVNLIKVAGAQQVLLKVRFVEASRSAERDLGLNWFGSNAKGTRGVNLGLGSVDSAGPSSTTGLPIFSTSQALANSSAAPFAVALGHLVSKGANIDVAISALEKKGLARRLAEPDLVALSGDSASFLAGGEVPVPVVQSSSGSTPSISVEYKPFGVQLTFMPTVLANGLINLRLAPSVSELDYVHAVKVSGFAIPALTKREARTTIELHDGQSFAIAGLLQSEGVRNISQLPWIASVPVLGALFRSSEYQRNETDLVVIVTPYLAAPATPSQVLTTPLDGRRASNDADFFLFGQVDVARQHSGAFSPGGDLSGPYGHSIPSPGK